jgi:uncharacterized protein (DUF58 family)
MRRPFVKRYIEERELTVVLAVDLSGSERFGTVRRFKSELATELGAVLAMSAVRNNDRVGIMLKGRLVAQGPIEELARLSLGVGQEQYTLEEIYMRYFRGEEATAAR